MNKYKVSIIIPVFNMEEYIKECLDSILNQTLKEIEIICIDDCSTDKSSEIIKNFKDFRIKYIKLDRNSGSAIARNRGIDEANGEFVIFMDPDDYYYNNNAIRVLYDSASKNNMNIVAGNMITLNTKDDKQDIFTGAINFNETKFYSFRNDYLSCFGYQRFLFSTNFLKNNNLYFPNYLRRQDPPFFLKVMLLNDFFLGINNFIYVYRLFHKNVNWDINKKIDFINAYKENFIICEKENLPYHFMREFSDFKYHVLQKNQFKITKDILSYVNETKKSISYNLFKNGINSIKEHEQHSIKYLLDRINLYLINNIIIYGFGNIGIKLYEQAKHTYTVKQIIDKDLHGIYVDNLKISKNVNSNYFDCLIILTVFDEIIKIKLIEKLIKKGFKYEQIIYIKY